MLARCTGFAVVLIPIPRDSRGCSSAARLHGGARCARGCVHPLRGFTDVLAALAVVFIRCAASRMCSLHSRFFWCLLKQAFLRSTRVSTRVSIHRVAPRESRSFGMSTTVSPEVSGRTPPTIPIYRESTSTSEASTPANAVSTPVSVANTLKKTPPKNPHKLYLCCL